MFTLITVRDRAGSPNIRDTQTMYIGRGSLDISEDLKYGKTWVGSNIPLMLLTQLVQIVQSSWTDLMINLKTTGL